MTYLLSGLIYTIKRPVSYSSETGIEQVPTIELDEDIMEYRPMMEHFKDGVPFSNRCMELKITAIYVLEKMLLRRKVSLYADHPVYIKSKILTGEIVFN
jgi:hypothetical protein